MSNDLAPGDVYEVSDPSLTQMPADSLLLAGDCIMNESMLTGANYPPLFCSWLAADVIQASQYQSLRFQSPVML